MRLPAAQARAISRGAKTQLRVPVDTRITARPLRPARRHSGRPLNPSIGDILPIDSDERTYCKILTATRGPLGTLIPEDAQAEGHPTVDEFEIDWVERHDAAYLDRQITYLIEANVPVEEAEETRVSWAKVRYDQFWALREVWHLTIQPFDDMPYLLEGLPDEPEGIPVERLRQRWVTKAATRHQNAHAEVLEDKLAVCLTVEERIGVIRREAYRQGRDIRSHLRAIDRRIEDVAKMLQIDKAA